MPTPRRASRRRCRRSRRSRASGSATSCASSLEARQPSRGLVAARAHAASSRAILPELSTPAIRTIGRIGRGRTGSARRSRDRVRLAAMLAPLAGQDLAARSSTAARQARAGDPARPEVLERRSRARGAARRGRAHATRANELASPPRCAGCSRSSTATSASRRSSCGRASDRRTTCSSTTARRVLGRSDSTSATSR